MTSEELCPMSPSRRRRPTRALAVLVLLLSCVATGLSTAAPASAQSYVPVSGAGSTWSQNALDQWRRNVNQYGMTINYAGTGSSDGRNQYKNGTVDFAVSEIPYGLKDGNVVDEAPRRGSAYMPIVAGGTAFMYNLKIGGRRVTNLRLSGENVARIFTGTLTLWNDPAIAADNPGLTLPARAIVPVVRSDGSGTTAQFTTWLSKRYASSWDPYCAKAGRPTPCGITSNYPVVPSSGFTAQSGSLGVSGYVSQEQNEGTITYVEYSYALNTGYPVAKVLNKGGFYVEPNADNVAVGLLQARIVDDERSPQYLTQVLDGVYDNADRRAYPLSSYSYMVVPTKAEGSFNTEKGKTLAAFAYYFLCEGQQQAPVLGYSPLPINLVQAGLQQVRRIPGVVAQDIDISRCNNPTFSKDGRNTLATRAPQPPACDARGSQQCGTGTGGAKAPTPVKPAAAPAPRTGAGGGAAPVRPGRTTVGSTTTTATPRGPGLDTVAQVDPETGQVLQPVVDPDTGEVVGFDAAGGQDQLAGGAVSAVPVSVGAALSGGTTGALAVLAGLLLLVGVLAPPLLSRRLARGRS